MPRLYYSLPVSGLRPPNLPPEHRGRAILSPARDQMLWVTGQEIPGGEPITEAAAEELVRTTWDRGEGVWASIRDGSVPGLVDDDPPPELGTISDLSAMPGDAAASLSWTPAENATSQQPQYRAVGSGTWLDFGSPLGAEASGVTVTGLMNEVEYEFRVVSGDGSSTTASNTVATTPVEPGGVGLLFQSTWGTALGLTDTALRDGGTWGSRTLCTVPSTNQPATGVQEVVEAPGTFRTPNALRMRHTGVDGYCGQVAQEPMVPVSTTHWGRQYFRSDLGNWGGGWHNFSYNFVGLIQIVYFRPNGEESGWFLGLHFRCDSDGVEWGDKGHPASERGNWLLQTSQANPSDAEEFVGATSPNRILFDHHAWYRYEWHVEYITPTSFRFWPRLYSAAGTLLYDASDYYNVWHLQGSLVDYYAGGGAFGMTSTELMRNFGIGNEGRIGGSEAFWYVGDVAFSLQGWIGDTE